MKPLVLTEHDMFTVPASEMARWAADPGFVSSLDLLALELDPDETLSAFASEMATYGYDIVDDAEMKP